MANINYSTSIQEPTLSGAGVTAFIRYKKKRQLQEWMLTKLRVSTVEWRSKSYKNRDNQLFQIVENFRLERTLKNQNCIQELTKSISNSENAHYHSIRIPICSPKI